MKIFIFICFMSCVAIAACGECVWTGCVSSLDDASYHCNKLNLGRPSGRTNDSNCGWFDRKVQCCQEDPPAPGCQWTPKFYGSFYGGDYACQSTFGKGYRPARTRHCSGIATQRNFECCKN
ncbi:hypothetical protein Bhyg_16763 [Pseudolycoriella hygida]|uniref:Uncharacterized protein n=1 Tax=Pseudolycoriella hygida TaxID=35572 RepID=A0A9Q0MKA2_9DIPT|nr:hypothetical protein Bhyg_16763 [Pseudolycoriella hygida]